MLASVKKIVAKPLDNALRNYLNRRDPKNQDIMPLLNALEDSIPMSKRTGLPDLSDVTEWCKSKPDGGLYALLKGVTQGLIQWSMQPAMSVMPITYTHRQLIMGIRLIGPQGVLRLLLEELRFHTRSDADMRNQNDQQQQEQQQLNHQDQIAGVVYDVATALACAPNVTNMPPAAPWIDNPPPGQQQAPPQVERMMGVPEVLRLEADKCRKMQKTDPDRAEIVVRLHRRVEAQLAPPQAPPGMMPAPDMGGMDMSGGMDMGANAEVSLDDAMAAMQSDPSGVGLDMSLDPLGSGDGGGDGMGGDDLFGGLDTNIDTNLDDLDWGDGMDLS
jgi:mediator of RNA polymerase II transcription subunit 5